MRGYGQREVHMVLAWVESSSLQPRTPARPTPQPLTPLLTTLLCDRKVLSRLKLGPVIYSIPRAWLLPWPTRARLPYVLFQPAVLGFLIGNG